MWGSEGARRVLASTGALRISGVLAFGTEHGNKQTCATTKMTAPCGSTVVDSSERCLVIVQVIHGLSEKGTLVIPGHAPQKHPSSVWSPFTSPGQCA